MTKKRPVFGYDENGNPIYLNSSPRNSVNPDLQPAKWNKEMGRNIEVGKRNVGLAGATTAQYGAAVQRPKDYGSSPEPDLPSGGNAKLAVDYSKDPYSTSVPGQPGYDASKDSFRGKAAEADAKKQAEDEKMRKFLERVPSGMEWWQRSRGEKTGGSGLDAVHSDASEARRLQRMLDDERKYAESLYPGAGGRQHSKGGTNLGEPSWSGSGGGAFRQGAAEWVTRSGTVVGQNGVELVTILESWNIYSGP